MAQVMRISLPGYNALTESDINNYALYTDSDNILIKEHSRGSGDVDFNDSVSINHNLSYVPAYIVYGETSSGYRLINAQNPVGGGWKTYSNTTNLVIENDYHADYTGYRYYIFYDDMSTAGSPSISESDMAIKMSKAGVNAATSTNPNEYIFHSDLNTFKIIAEGSLTSQTVDADPKTFTVLHNQSNEPAVYAFAKFPDGYVVQAGDKERADNTSPVERYWFLEVDSSNVRFIFYKGTTANYSVDIKYYIFESPAT